MLTTIDYLSKIGFDALSPHTVPQWSDEDDARAVDEAARVALAIDHEHVRDSLLAAAPQKNDNYHGVSWLGLAIDWPDRVPALKVWAGQQTLEKILLKLQKMLRSADCVDVFLARANSKGATGLDAMTCQNPLDIGFSPNDLGMLVEQRPGVELLAIVGLSVVPLISWSRNLCGFLHDGRIWQFAIEKRGDYYGRWSHEVRDVSYA